MSISRGRQRDCLWRRVDALIDTARTSDDLRSHRLEVLAARRARAAGRAVPPDFVGQERLAAIASVTAPRVLELIARAHDGPVIVLKGPEIASRYPEPAMRAYGDLDVLVENANEAQRALLVAGFEPVGDPSLYVGIHHLRPLRASGLILSVEIHSRPKWLDGLRPPPVAELFDVATASSTGVKGVLSLPTEHHALLLAVHSWAHEPLRRLRDIVDIALMSSTGDRDEIERLASSWGVEHVWRTTSAVIDSLFSGRVPPAVLWLWAQNLRTARERTVLENHLQRWLSDFWALPFLAAVQGLPRRMLSDVLPEGEEAWQTKLGRASLAVRDARRPRSRHESELRTSADRPRADDDV